MKGRKMGCGNHLPHYVNSSKPTLQRKSKPKITLNLHVRRGNPEDAQLIEELDALPHLEVNPTFVSGTLGKSLGAPYIPPEGDRGKLSGAKLSAFLDKIK